MLPINISKNAQKQNMIREEGYEWLVMVMGEHVWVCMGAHGCIGVGEHKKQARKDAHASNAHDFPATMPGKFPKIHVLERGDTEGHGRSNMVTDGFATMHWGMGNDAMHRKGHVGALGGFWV